MTNQPKLHLTASSPKTIDALFSLQNARHAKDVVAILDTMPTNDVLIYIKDKTTMLQHLIVERYIKKELPIRCAQFSYAALLGYCIRKTFTTVSFPHSPSIEGLYRRETTNDAIYYEGKEYSFHMLDIIYDLRETHEKRQITRDEAYDEFIKDPLLLAGDRQSLDALALRSGMNFAKYHLNTILEQVAPSWVALDEEHGEIDNLCMWTWLAIKKLEADGLF